MAKRGVLGFLCTNMLSIMTVTGVVLGIGIGVGIRGAAEEPYTNTDDLIKGLRIPGDLLLRGLNFLVLPLVVTSLILGMAGNNRGKFNQQAGLTLLYYICTTIIAVIIGLIMVSVISPGVSYSAREDAGVSNDEKVVRNSNATVLDFVIDMIKNIVPSNIVAMAHMKTRTVYDYEVNTATEERVLGMNMLGVIFVSIAIGVVVMANRKECAAFLDFCLSVNVIVNKLTRAVLHYSPIGIMFLVMAEYSVSDVNKYAQQIGMYIATVLAGLGIHFFLVLPGILFFFTQRNPLTFYKHLLPAMATAFGTASSTVTIPLTMKCTKKAGVSDDVVDFVVPVGATINMDGTALYEAVACLFIAQLNEVQLTNPEIVITAVTATVAAIGAAGIPSAGLVTLVMVLNAVNLDTRHIALILTIDWFLDRFRTLTNVVGDSVGCAVIEKISGSSRPAVHANGDDTEFKKLKNVDETVEMDNAVGA